MPIVARRSYNAPLTMDNINPGEVQLGIRPQNVPYHYSRCHQDVVSRAPNDKENCSTEPNLYPDPAGHKVSMPTYGDWSDGQPRCSSGTATDVTNPDTTKRSPKDRDGEGLDVRNEKKKMKRFRLTHSQTRYLMSEFTRQSHPDAAHRERLSREIPGLSPRQVQVWFQNRRAKLKRLTSDDRERMLKSRALPDGFDMTQTLHSPYTDFTPSANGQFQSPGSYYQDKHLVTPAPAFTGLRPYKDEYTISPLSATSTWDSYFSLHLTPTPKDDISPPEHMSEPSSDESHPYITSTGYPSLSRPVWNGPSLPFRFGDISGQARVAPLAPSSHSNDPVASTPLHHTAAPLCIEIPRSNVQDFNGTTSSPTFFNDDKVDDVYCDKPGSASPRVSTTTSKIPPGSQLKPGIKNLKPAVQSAPIPTSQDCEASPLSPHLSSNLPGAPYPPQLGTATSLPPSPFYLDRQHRRHSDEHRASPAKDFHEHLPSLSNPNVVPFTSGFPFTSSI